MTIRIQIKRCLNRVKGEKTFFSLLFLTADKNETLLNRTDYLALTQH